VYDIQIKPHYSTTWTDLCEFPEGYFSPSSTQSTVVTFQFSNPPSYVVAGDSTATGLTLTTSDVMMTVPLGGQVDFQVRAGIGHGGAVGFADWVFNGELSGWSPTQTVTISANIPLSPTPTASSSTSTLTPTPTLTSVSGALNASLLLITTIALVVIAFLLVIIISLILYMKKRRIA
jgi:hypothetical protein